MLLDMKFHNNKKASKINPVKPLRISLSTLKVLI
jgi:hypothetical protein